MEKVEEGLGKMLMEGDKGRRPEMAGTAAEATSAQLTSTRAGREGERERKQGSSEGDRVNGWFTNKDECGALNEDDRWRCPTRGTPRYAQQPVWPVGLTS